MWTGCYLWDEPSWVTEVLPARSHLGVKRAPQGEVWGPQSSCQRPPHSCPHHRHCAGGPWLSLQLGFALPLSEQPETQAADHPGDCAAGMLTYSDLRSHLSAHQGGCGRGHLWPPGDRRNPVRREGPRGLPLPPKTDPRGAASGGSQMHDGTGVEAAAVQ